MYQILILGILFTCGVHAQGDAEWLAERMKALEKAEVSINAEHKKQADALKVRYVTALERVSEKAKNEGNLDIILDVRAEANRVMKGIRPNGQVSAASVLKLRTSYERQTADLSKKAWASHEKVIKAAKVRLTEKVKELTKKNEIEAATAVNKALQNLEDGGGAVVRRGFGGRASFAAPERTSARGFPPSAEPRISAKTPVAPAIVANGPLPPWLARDLTLYVSGDQLPPGRLFKSEGPQPQDCELHGRPKIVPGRRNGAMLFSEEGDYIDVKPFVLGEELTISSWVYYDRWCAYGHILKMSDGQVGREISIHTDKQQGRLRVVLTGDQPKRPVIRWYANQAPSQTWIHLVMSFDKEGMLSIYRDGRKVAGAATGQKMDRRPREVVRIARDINAGGVTSPNGVFGKVDELMVHRRALSDKEVQALYRWAGGK